MHTPKVQQSVQQGTGQGANHFLTWSFLGEEVILSIQEQACTKLVKVYPKINDLLDTFTIL